MASAALAGLCLLALPILAGRALDAATTPGTEPLPLRNLALIFLACAVAEALLRAFARRTLVGRSRTAEADLKSDLHRRMLRSRLRDLRRYRPGDLLVRLNDDVEQLRFATGPLLLHGTQSLVVLPGAALSLGTLQLETSLALSFVTVVLLFAIRRLAPSLGRAGSAVQEQLAAVGSTAEISLQDPLSRRSLGLEDRSTQAIENAADELSQAKIGLATRRARLDAMLHLTLQGSGALLLWFGGVAVLEGGNSSGDLLRGFATLGIAWQPLLAAGFLASVLPRALAAGERIEDVFDLDQQPAPRPLEGDDDELNVFVDITPPSKVERRTFSIWLTPRRFVGITGVVGSGKSRLLQHLAGLTEPEELGIRFESLPHVGSYWALGKLPPDQRSKLIAYLESEPLLFEGTVRENLELASTSPLADAAMQDALRTAGLGPDAPGALALDDRIGEGGETRSGGQRQRLALARALLSGAPCLCLDDALSALDARTTEDVLQALRATDRALVVVAHRLETIQQAEEIYWLEDGEVRARGDHAFLHQSFEPYRRAFDSQAADRGFRDGEGGIS